MIKEYTIDDLKADCCPRFNSPTEVSFMSISEDEKYNFVDKIVSILDESALNPLIRHDILSGYTERFVPSSSTQDVEYILHLLLHLKEKKGFCPGKFISYRGSITKISALPYENMENLTLSFIKLNGNIFFWWYSSADLKCNPTSDNLKSMYSGYRFEKLITKEHKNPNNDGPLNQCSFLSAVQTKLYSSSFSHDLFYVGEIDCIRQRDNKYIEIKSRIKKSNDFALKRFCFLKWWLQSYLIGVDTVIVGFRNQDFIVEDILEYDTNFFISSNNNLWNPNQCLSFLGNLLSEVEKFMLDFCDSDICLVKFNVKSKKITFAKENQSEISQYDFLPTWFRTKWNI